MKTKGVDFFLFYVSDYKKAVSFYRDVLGLWLIKEYDSTWAEFEIKNAVLILAASNDEADADDIGRGTFALAVDDVKAAAEELRKEGIKILSEPQDTETCAMARIADPDGNKIILHRRKDGTAG